MKVINRNIMVFEPSVPEKKSAGGIILSTDKVDYSAAISAEVLAVGEEVKYVKVGDKVYYLPRTGDTIKTENGVYRIFDETLIIAVE